MLLAQRFTLSARSKNDHKGGGLRGQLNSDLKTITDLCAITVEQLRAARGLLGWSQSKLASQSGLSLPTIRRVEAGSGPRVSDEARLRIKATFVGAGIEFIEENGGGDGVRFSRPRREIRQVERGHEHPAEQQQLDEPVPGASKKGLDVLKVSNFGAPSEELKVSIKQIKAARALLGWPQERLAQAANLSVPTIKRLEAQDGLLAGRTTTGQKIEVALKKAGIEFIDENGGGPGVRLKKKLNAKPARKT
jgi:transcriptional regulator with XRE-family HTH domain